jgi:flavin reductase (DIM6/NTAB) family NADH-FMN oxidoreductase RutF
VNGDALAQLCASLDFPMAVVTAFDGRERSGCLVGFHTQCSIAPHRWLVCISVANHTYRIAQASEWLVVHVLRDDERALAELFGAVTGDVAPHEKFDRCSWRPGPGGVPVLAGCDWVAGRVLERIEVGDHVAHLLDIAEVGIDHVPAPQLGSQHVRDIHPGHPA